MRYSRMFIPTVKEVPADAEVTSHKLMIRAALCRKLASGTYIYLPLGWRILLKIIEIVREEMNKAGAQEIIVPSMQPAELWDKTGRSIDYGQTLFHLKDRHGRESVLMPTAEEVFTFLAAGEISSYKQLPINLYQITTKFRDEFRPRFGVIRSREFIMKDAYSFDADDESLDQTYKIMYDAYCRIFKRCGLDYVVVEAESGQMGGSGSHQFTVPCQSGEDTIVYTEDGSYAANLEKAAVDPLPKEKPDAEIPPMQEVHTHELNPEKLTQILGGKHIELADEPTIEKVTGARVGFAGPMGIADKVSKVIIDHAVAAMPVGVTGANKTDYHVKSVVPGRDFPLEGENVIVADIRYALEGDTHNGKKLLFKKGIEVGQVFKLGTKYSEKLGAKFLDENGGEKPCLMGCYGIGINRILASAIEISHDKNGVIFPVTIAPFEVLVTCVNQDDEEVAKAAENIYRQLLDNDIDVLLDDRPLRGGVKFKDADLLGIPVRVTVGKKSLAKGNVEIKLRAEPKSKKIPLENAADETIELVNSLKEKLRV